MTRHLFAVAFLGLCMAGSASHAADTYALDGSHSAVTFKISHAGLSWTYGRFKDVSGDFTIDGEKSTFSLTIKADSIDTDNVQRDTHLKSPDFFNTKQYPTITFKTTAVKVVKDGFEVTGDFSMHGVTKSITFPLLGGKTAELPKGVMRTGYSTALVLKRTDFMIGQPNPFLGEEVHIEISFEGTKK